MPGVEIASRIPEDDPILPRSFPFNLLKPEWRVTLWCTNVTYRDMYRAYGDLDPSVQLGEDPPLLVFKIRQPEQTTTLRHCIPEGAVSLPISGYGPTRWDWRILDYMNLSTSRMSQKTRVS